MSATTVQKVYGELLSLSIAERFEVIRLAMGSLQKECEEKECSDTPPVRKRSLLELRSHDKEIWEGINPVEGNKPKNSTGKRPRSELWGCMEGQIWMADDFDAPLEEMREYME